MINFVLLQTTQRIGHPILGIIIPGLILALSFVMTLMLIRYFNKKQIK